MPAPRAPLPFVEFVALLALMVSIVAMSTDVMLPALGVIAEDLAVADRNDTQLVVSALFAGFAVGQLIVGPLSDRFGRRSMIQLGYAVFALGCVLSILATDLTTMLIGRVLQGLGAAGPRVLTVAMVRDLHSGAAMARIMSFIMSVFILVPALAPAVGQVVVSLAGWRHCFTLLLLLAMLACLWFTLRQPETLGLEARRPLSLGGVARAMVAAMAVRRVRGYTLTTGLVFGAFIGYLSSAQQVFQETYGLGPLFPLYFSGAALAIGAAALVNARLVTRLGMRRLATTALVGLAGLSALFLPVALATGGVPPLAAFMGWLVPAAFCLGILFGNLNALAMEPLGDMAGLGASLVGSASTLLSLPLGWFIGSRYDGGVTAVVAGCLILIVAALAVVRWTEHWEAADPA